ncbi:MAG: 50S ribosomal protein L1 [Armatimonadetes bacterium]|nr:MAG: 50S ribosomal protein L1 [Armatimonadota bacterium]
MGKIRVKTLGDEQAEQKQKEQKRKERQEKKRIKTPEVKGGEKPAVAEITEKSPETQKIDASVAPTVSEKPKKKEKFLKSKIKGKRYQENLKSTNKNSTYDLPKAVEILKNFKKSKFNETVELHINMREKGVSGQVDLPHGTGKQRRIKVADDTLIAQIEKGKIDFDVLVAAPQMMSKLARVAKILGPRGLMPNPKTGTISPEPEKVVEKLSKGQVSYKTESQAPIIHLSVGKVSFENKQLEENIKAVISSIGSSKITNATLKSTMSPGIKLNLTSFAKQ